MEVESGDIGELRIYHPQITGIGTALWRYTVSGVDRVETDIQIRCSGVDQNVRVGAVAMVVYGVVLDHETALIQFHMYRELRSRRRDHGIANDSHIRDSSKISGVDITVVATFVRDENIVPDNDVAGRLILPFNGKRLVRGRIFIDEILFEDVV